MSGIFEGGRTSSRVIAEQPTCPARERTRIVERQRDENLYGEVSDYGEVNSKRGGEIDRNRIA